jgi:putative lipoic acid-binding regulatory protein
VTLPDERERAIKLLEETHEFPGEYHLSVIVMNDESVVDDVQMAVEFGRGPGAEPVKRQTTPSSGSKYLSLRFSVLVADADAVLALHARVRVIKGVVRVI